MLYMELPQLKKTSQCWPHLIAHRSDLTGDPDERDSILFFLFRPDKCSILRQASILLEINKYHMGLGYSSLSTSESFLSTLDSESTLLKHIYWRHWGLQNYVRSWSSRSFSKREAGGWTPIPTISENNNPPTIISIHILPLMIHIRIYALLL